MPELTSSQQDDAETFLTLCSDMYVRSTDR